MDKVAIVMGIGIDKSPKMGEVDMTVQVVNTAGIKSSSTETGPEKTKSYFNLEKTGDTIFNIIRELSKMSSRRLFFSQNQVIILSKGIAQEGLENTLISFIETQKLGG